MNHKKGVNTGYYNLALAGAMAVTLFLAEPAAANQGYGKDLGADNQEIRAQLEQLGKVLEPFHSYDVARAAGWNATITPCMVDMVNGTGAMGFHVANIPELENGTLQMLRPEALIYVPWEDGSMEFLGVEYIVPDPNMALPAPELFGQTFNYVPGAGIWALHVWSERHNPLGLFAPWNPTVSCEFAPPPNQE